MGRESSQNQMQHSQILQFYSTRKNYHLTKQTTGFSTDTFLTVVILDNITRVFVQHEPSNDAMSTDKASHVDTGITKGRQHHSMNQKHSPAKLILTNKENHKSQNKWMIKKISSQQILCASVCKIQTSQCNLKRLSSIK
jgi:hypothetical protein